MTPRYFASPTAFRAWLRANHASKAELWVGLFKAASGRVPLTYKEALDEALGYGWIDGVRKTVDADRWTIRFTPRRPGSVWSRVNLKRAAELLKEGRLAAAGRKAYEGRDRQPRRGYSYENRPKRLAPARDKAFRAEPAAWAFFETQPPHYRKMAFFWVESAAKEETRSRRFSALLAASARGRRLGPIEGKKA